MCNQVLWPKLSSHRLHRPDPSADKPGGQPDQAAAKGRGLPGHHRSSPQITPMLPHPDQMRRPYEAWCSIRLAFFQRTVVRFFQSVHSIWMNFDTGRIQTHYVYLDFEDTELLQTQKGCLQHTLFCPALHPDIDHVPIPVFFGQAPPFAPILYEVQHRIQHVQVTDFCWFPLRGKAVFDLLILLFFYLHSSILSQTPISMNST